MDKWVDVCDETAVLAETFITADAEGIHVIIFNRQGKLYAVKDTCPHDGGILSNGQQQGDEIICPRHGARFNIKTGAVTAPPATEGLSIFELRLKNDQIQINLGD